MTRYPLLLPPDMLAALRQEANARRITVAALMRMWLQDGLDASAVTHPRRARVPAMALVLSYMREHAVDQETAIRALGGVP